MKLIEAGNKIAMEKNNINNTPASIVPEWVKSELFESVLKDSIEGYSKIKSFTANGDIGPGENFGSVMLRVTIEIELVDGKDKTVAYMLKLPYQRELF